MAETTMTYTREVRQRWGVFIYNEKKVAQLLYPPHHVFLLTGKEKENETEKGVGIKDNGRNEKSCALNSCIFPLSEFR